MEIIDAKEWRNTALLFLTVADVRLVGSSAIFGGWRFGGKMVAVWRCNKIGRKLTSSKVGRNEGNSLEEVTEGMKIPKRKKKNKEKKEEKRKTRNKAKKKQWGKKKCPLQ